MSKRGWIVPAQLAGFPQGHGPTNFDTIQYNSLIKVVYLNFVHALDFRDTQPRVGLSMLVNYPNLKEAHCKYRGRDIKVRILSVSFAACSMYCMYVRMVFTFTSYGRHDVSSDSWWRHGILLPNWLSFFDSFIFLFSSVKNEATGVKSLISFKQGKKSLSLSTSAAATLSLSLSLI